MRRFCFFAFNGRRLVCAALATVVLLSAAGICAARSLISRDLPVDVSGPETRAEDGVCGRHLRFLADCGWAAAGPVSVETVRVPKPLNAIYETYNRLQLAQGFDLRPYAGRTLEKYVYTVENDPAAAAGETVCANILEADGEIVGGDICAPAPDGFIHGFHGETDGYDQTG